MLSDLLGGDVGLAPLSVATDDALPTPEPRDLESVTMLAEDMECTCAPIAPPRDARDSVDILAVVKERAEPGTTLSRDSDETLAVEMERADRGALLSRGVISIPVGMSVAILLWLVFSLCKLVGGENI